LKMLMYLDQNSNKQFLSYQHVLLMIIILKNDFLKIETILCNVRIYIKLGSFLQIIYIDKSIELLTFLNRLSPLST